MRENPVFGSESSADDASDILAEVLGGASIVSALSTPGGPGGGSDWANAKAKGLLVEFAAVSVAGAATTTLKNSVNRERPDKSNDRSFPS